MPKKNEEKCVCCRCGGDPQNISEFYKSYSDFYSNGHLPICKTCFNSLFKVYLEKYKSSKMAIQRMCMAFDLYFNEDLFDKCDANDETVVGVYIRKLNLSQHKTKTFETTIDEGFLLSGDRKPIVEKKVVTSDEYGNEEETEKIDPADIEKWGVGLTQTDYQNLNNHYKYLKGANPHCDSNQEIFINDLCYAKMQQLKCVRDGDMENYKKMGDYYNSTFLKSGLKVAADESANSDDCLGVWNARISQYTPEEYYKNKELYKDHDGLGGYVERFMLRPLRNLMHGTTDRDTEFYVKDSGDEDELVDDTE